MLKSKMGSIEFCKLKQVHKVLYLDFENMGAMESKKQTFQSGYIPEARADECRANLIMKDVADCAIDFSLPENHQKFLMAFSVIPHGNSKNGCRLPVLMVGDTRNLPVYADICYKEA